MARERQKSDTQTGRTVVEAGDTETDRQSDTQTGAEARYKAGLSLRENYIEVKTQK